MIYVVIDTNVLVSALLNMNSNPGTVLLSVFKGKTIPLLNPEILAEYREVLARKKFKFPAEEIETVLKELTTSSLNVTALPKDYPEVNDPKDRCFYAVTMTGRQKMCCWLQAISGIFRRNLLSSLRHSALKFCRQQNKSPAPHKCARMSG